MQTQSGHMRFRTPLNWMILKTFLNQFTLVFSIVQFQMKHPKCMLTPSVTLGTQEYTKFVAADVESSRPQVISQGREELIYAGVRNRWDVFNL